MELAYRSYGGQLSWYESNSSSRNAHRVASDGISSPRPEANAPVKVAGRNCHKMSTIPFRRLKSAGWASRPPLFARRRAEGQPSARTWTRSLVSMTTYAGSTGSARPLYPGRRRRGRIPLAGIPPSPTRLTTSYYTNNPEWPPVATRGFFVLTAYYPTSFSSTPILAARLTLRHVRALRRRFGVPSIDGLAITQRCGSGGRPGKISRPRYASL